MSKFSSILRLFSKSEKQTPTIKTNQKVSFYTTQRKRSGLRNPNATLIEVIDPVQVLPTGEEVSITPHYFLSKPKA